jgi:hypothetical protein
MKAMKPIMTQPKRSMV